MLTSILSTYTMNLKIKEEKEDPQEEWGVILLPIYQLIKSWGEGASPIPKEKKSWVKVLPLSQTSHQQT